MICEISCCIPTILCKKWMREAGGFLLHFNTLLAWSKHLATIRRAASYGASALASMAAATQTVDSYENVVFASAKKK